MTDVIVIGGGVNGLVAGALLAKQKLSVIVLDQRPVVGGAAVTTEFAPGSGRRRSATRSGPSAATSCARSGSTAPASSSSRPIRR